MMLKLTEAVLVLPVIMDCAVTKSVCGPGESSVGLIESAHPLKSNAEPYWREMIDPCGLPGTLRNPLPDTRTIPPCAQPAHGAPKLPKMLLSPLAGGLSMYAVMVLIPAPRFCVAMPEQPEHPVP